MLRGMIRVAEAMQECCMEQMEMRLLSMCIRDLQEASYRRNEEQFITGSYCVPGKGRWSAEVGEANSGEVGYGDIREPRAQLTAHRSYSVLPRD